MTWSAEHGGEDRTLVVVEDVVTTGGQILASTQALRELGATVTTAVCVIERQPGAGAELAKAGIEVRPLFKDVDLEPATD